MGKSRNVPWVVDRFRIVAAYFSGKVVAKLRNSLVLLAVRAATRIRNPRVASVHFRPGSGVRMESVKKGSQSSVFLIFVEISMLIRRILLTPLVFSRLFLLQRKPFVL